MEKGVDEFRTTAAAAATRSSAAREAQHPPARPIALGRRHRSDERSSSIDRVSPSVRLSLSEPN